MREEIKALIIQLSKRKKEGLFILLREELKVLVSWSKIQRSPIDVRRIESICKLVQDTISIQKEMYCCERI